MAKRPRKTDHTSAYLAVPKPSRVVTPPREVVGSKSAKASKPGKTGMIRARVKPEVKIQAEGILARLGLNASDAVRLFYQQVILRRGLPFDVRIPNAATRKALRDADAGRNMTWYRNVDEMFKDLSADGQDET
jgi:DNA-damage-inducible protein J